MSSSDFIEVYDQVLSPEHCKSLIKKFERSRSKFPGVTGHGENLAAKDSLDINISLDQEWEKEHAEICEITWRYVLQYMRKYIHLISGAVSITVPGPDGQPLLIKDQIALSLEDSTLSALIQKIYRFGTINLQKYDRKRGGYHHFHSETYPTMGDPEQLGLHRVLLFMYYLNDVREGGQTEFYYQQRSLQPTRGQLVIAPSGFTHTHKGHIPQSNDKYILTSWILFRSADEIYANQMQR